MNIMMRMIFKDETYINFTGNISVIENYNNTNFKKENKFHTDSGTGINLTNELNNLKKKKKILMTLKIKILFTQMEN